MPADGSRTGERGFRFFSTVGGSEPSMLVAAVATEDEDSGRLSHPPALAVFCWGFPQAPAKWGCAPFGNPRQGPIFIPMTM